MVIISPVEDVFVVQASISKAVASKDGRSKVPALYSKKRAQRIAQNLNRNPDEAHGKWHALPAKLSVLPDPKSLRPTFANT